MDYKYKSLVTNKTKKRLDLPEKVFPNELALLANPDIKNFVCEVIRLAPTYFFSAPSSTSGKYHPAYECEKGGLILHSRAVVYFANELFGLDTCGKGYTDRETDLIICAALVHDMKKLGDNPYSKYTNFEHPRLMANTLRSYHDCGIIPNNEIDYIADMVETHMGQWNVNGKKSKCEPLPLPQTKPQKFLSMCDYLASRKDVDLSNYLDVEHQFIPVFSKSSAKGKTEYLGNKGEDTIMPIGQYKTQTLGKIFTENAEYLNWLYTENMQKKQNGERAFCDDVLLKALHDVLFE